MSDTQQLPLSVQPVISYPREAQVGKTYLMTINLQPSGDSEWLYEEEEYPIYCMLETSPLFSSKPVGEAAVVLHRFGGSYGAAKFLLTAAHEEMQGEIRVTLVNAWGVPIKVLNLVDLQVRQELTRLPNNKVVEFEIQKQEQRNNIDIDSLVKEVRQKVKTNIQERCGAMRVLDMTQPIGLNDIYTNVNILEKIPGQQRKDIAELLQEANLENFDRFGLGRITEKRVSGLEVVEKYSKLVILGKPGAGKTTFLKYVAIQCIDGKFQAERVPIFITLKVFAEVASKMSLLEYISEQFSSDGVTATQVTDLFNHNRTLVLLDGLDEIREEDSRRVLKEVRDFFNRFRDNDFVITCRIAAWQYTFEEFVEVEIADFSDQAIYTFATNWFKDKAEKAQIFISCIEENLPIKEIAINPLLLTLLCLAFEESDNFPANRSELYQAGLGVLLRKWDAARGIERDQVYKKLSVQRKEDLLGKIALATFEQGHYFFKQRAVEQYIADYLRTLPNADINSEALQLDSKAVLRSLEAQHGLLVERARGIYSFSHVTFHEYFTARKIVDGTQPLEQGLQNLVSHITDKGWREVFLLSVGMLLSADRLLQLMKQQIDLLVASDKKLQQFLGWVSQKSASVRVPFKPVAVRALYFHLDLDHAHNTISAGVSSVFKLPYTLDRAFAITPTFDLDHAFYNVLVLARALAPELVDASAFEIDGSSDIAPELKHSLQQLKEQLPDPYKDQGRFNAWRKAQGQAWAERLRAMIINYRNIGHDWQFNEQQKELLKEYYDANKLLVDCLNSDCYVSREVRQEIEDTLLLPIAEFYSSYNQFYEEKFQNKVSEASQLTSSTSPIQRKRSLTVRQESIQQVKSALLRSGFARQQDLAENLGLSRDTVSRFLNGKPVTYLNFLEICNILALNWKEVADLDSPRIQTSHTELPEAQVALVDSKIYVERPPIEKYCYEAILTPGALLRIKAPRQMGKTSLMVKIARYAEQQGYQTVFVSFQLADEVVLTDVNKFMQWFCASISHQLHLPNQLANYWDEALGSNLNCTVYFEEYLLDKVNNALIIGLDEVDRIFQYREVAENFFFLLRSWHEKARFRSIWGKIRFVLLHSTEFFVSLNINLSPFNVGQVIQLQEFSPEQVMELARRYELNWNTEQVHQLMNMVGGHPYLIQQAFECISRESIPVEQFLATAPTEAGYYGDHLRGLLLNLRQHPELATAFIEVVTAEKPVQLEPILTYKLNSMGLVQLQGNEVLPRCELYRQYFSNRLTVPEG